MRRSIPAAIVVLAGLLLLLDFVVINPTLIGVADALLRLLVLLAAAAALAGAAALLARHGRNLLDRGPERTGSAVLVAGLAGMLAAGFYPGSQGAADPVVRWLVAALLAPLIASLFAMLFVFLLIAMRRGMSIRSRQMGVMLAAAAAVVGLMLPLGGAVGGWLGTAAAWSMTVPIGGAFRGLLIGVGIVTAVHASRILLAVNAADD